MDIELLKSTSAQDQMEMLTMMMQLNKLPHFSNFPEIEFSGGTTESPPLPFFHNPPITTPVQPPLTQSLFMPQFTTLEKKNPMESMREMIFRMAVMQPIYIDPESVKPPKRKNVKTSKDPQSVAARHRRERISERIRILQRLVPGGTKMDTASMLDEAVHYVKFLKKQVQTLEQGGNNMSFGVGVQRQWLQL